MFDKNYLNHNFYPIQFNGYMNHYKCGICNTVIWVDYGSKTINSHIIDIYDDRINYKSKLISCDEMIIKNIIE